MIDPRRHASAAFGLGFGAIYLSCLGMRVYLGDSGELAAAAHTLDIPHPPGYPLWLLIARLFDLLPFGTSAWRAALLSAAAGAAALALLHRVALRHATSGAAFASLALLGTSPLYWEQCVLPEVYALHGMLFSIVLLLVTREGEGGGGGENGREDPRPALLAGYAAGLATVAHPLGAGTWLFVALRTGRKRALALAMLAGVAAITITCVLLVRSGLDPVVDWGDPETPARLLAHITRSQYAIVERPAFSWELLARNATDLARGLADGSAVLLLLPLALLGATRLPVRTAVLFLAGSLLYGPVLAALLRFPPTPEETRTNLVFFTPLLIVLGAAAAAGVDRLALLLGRAGRFVPATLILIALVGAMREIPAHRMRDVRLPELYAHEMLTTLPANARLYVRGDDLLFPVLYLRQCLEVRPDVDVRNPAGTVYRHPGYEPPYYTNVPEGEPSPDALVFRTPGAPDAGAADVLDPRPERARIARDPHLRALWVNYMETLARTATDIDRAVRFRSEALAIQDPDVAHGDAFATATVLAERGDVEGARAALAGRAANGGLTPRESLLAVELQLVTIGSGRAGVQALAPIANADSWDGGARVWASRLHAIAGQGERARALVQAVLREDPYDEDALRLAFRFAEQDDDDQARALFAKRLLQIRPDDDAFRKRRAEHGD